MINITADLYSLILSELSDRQCAHVQKFPPYFTCCIGSHLFNLLNKKNHIYTDAGRIPDMRLHLMFVSPPGFSKTFWLEQYLRGNQALLSHSGIETGFEGAMTEAGFVGTIKFSNGETHTTMGAAKKYEKAILGIEEFSALTVMMQQSWNQQMDPALLGALDSGWVYKRLAAGNIAYPTNVTLMVGTQPARFDLSSGLGRRFLYVNFLPTSDDFALLKKARRRARNIRFNPKRTDRIRKELAQLKVDIEQIERIDFSKDVYEFLDRNKVVHYEDMLMERMLIGYTIMRGRLEKRILISLDSTSRELLTMELFFRDAIRRGAQFAQPIMILREHNGSLSKIELMDEMLKFGHDWKQSSELIGQLVRMKAIRLNQDGSVALSKRLRENKLE